MEHKKYLTRIRDIRFKFVVYSASRFIDYTIVLFGFDNFGCYAAFKSVVYYYLCQLIRI